ncbi:hypothetical protein DBIPINDM_003327 [Mesorhizobium sp. AR02]|uniref:hypothetical protein n=1 Tax=Mesorhizobium sp. AR02 TaxID=2865837 RepID=UPI00215E5EEC|nr:hypothetical protein [Mesorhizobium sp. AR02]UVK56705.1 hypothetical protein DBIPINDM_003327 [Mesorhizobium sp. AR02]
MRSKLLLLLMTLASSPAAPETIDQFSMGKWTGEVVAFDGRFSQCTLTGPKPDNPLTSQISISAAPDGQFSIWFTGGIFAPPTHDPNSFLGSGFSLGNGSANIDTGPTRIVIWIGKTDSPEGQPKEYTGGIVSNQMIDVEVPQRDDFVERIKSEGYVRGFVPSNGMTFFADLGSSALIFNPWADSDAYSAIQELKKCVATHTGN